MTPSSLAKPTWTSSRWALPLRTRPSSRPGTPGGSTMSPAAAPAAPPPPRRAPPPRPAPPGGDRGASTRQPASFCGIAGLKPTYGLVSRYGLVAFASSLDQIGPLAKDVQDCALLLQAIAGHDPFDSTSADLPVPDYSSALTGDIRGIRIGIPDEYFIEGRDPEVEAAIWTGMQNLARLGGKQEKASLPHTPYAVATSYLGATAAPSSNLARYDGGKYGYRTSRPPDLLGI